MCEGDQKNYIGKTKLLILIMKHYKASLFVLSGFKLFSSGIKYISGSFPFVK